MYMRVWPLQLTSSRLESIGGELQAGNAVGTEQLSLVSTASSVLLASLRLLSLAAV